MKKPQRLNKKQLKERDYARWQLKSFYEKHRIGRSKLYVQVFSDGYISMTIRDALGEVHGEAKGFENGCDPFQAYMFLRTWLNKVGSHSLKTRMKDYESVLAKAEDKRWNINKFLFQY